MERRAGIGKKLLSMLLATVMFVTAQEAMAFAETDARGTDATSARNPVYDTESDTTTWNYVSFGSYPQSEVTGEALTDEIIQAIYDKAGDAWVDGVKYRRLSRTDTDNSDYFGEGDYRYFKWEKIKWRVLNQDESGILTVIADQGLDCKKYEEESSAVSWRYSTLHNWLNNTFYTTAFNANERGKLQGSTGDKVYLLTKDKAVSTEYGFSDVSTKDSQSRRMKASAYANARGAFVDAQSGYEGNCWWWLRPEYDYNSYSAGERVTKEGKIETWDFGKTYGAVLPVIQLKEESANTLNPVYNSSTDDTTWNYVSLGSYPQTEIDAESDRALYVQLENASYTESGDVQIGENRYRRVEKSDNNYSYFKWEPIIWKILRADDSELFLMSNEALDAKYYDNSSNTSYDWENSLLRSWLNDTFYNAAFSDTEKSAIINKTVQNEANPSYSTGGGNSTEDNVYLLSIQEAETSVNGFRGDSSATSSREIQSSSYACHMGADAGNSRCWLRSPGGSSSYAAIVDKTGRVDRFGSNKSSGALAVVPVLHVSKTSTAWSLIENEGQLLRVSLEHGEGMSWSISEGGSETFSAIVTGAHPFGYTCQWYHAPSADEEGTRIDGATSSSYTIENATVADSGSYYCVVTSGKYQVTSGRTNLTVTEPTTITLSDTNLDLNVGARRKLTAAITPANSSVSWWSGNSDVAKVEYSSLVAGNDYPVKYSSVEATVTAVKEGTATIYISAGNTSESCTVTVKRDGEQTGDSEQTTITAITLKPDKLSLKAGAKGEVTAALTPASANVSVKWTSDNVKAAKVESNGGTKATITAVAAGKATITAEAGGKTASCVVEVTANTNTGTDTPPPGNSSPGTSTNPTVKLAAPKLTVKLSSANAVKLSWNKVSGAAGYYVYRSTSSKGKFTKVGTTKKTSFKNSKLKSKKTYYYKVAAYKGKTVGASSNTASKKILGKLSTPKMKFSNVAAFQKFTISWNKIKNASHIEIWRKVDRKGTYKKWKTVSAKKRKVTYSYRSYTRGHTYFYQIRAYYSKDKVKVYSGYSKGLGIQL
ncbi:hypothetical protein E5329_02740 [Petralouisia muris]|uniref:Uncharacterized protein n=1 Tax=Petralouisia muris TaxID=3032872 RepID=A0AC61S102_9FIRM|nr:DUF6273 domain-containing protein [Petralouisia muris]TGY97790.1 hypothetical protein E5329_02740 [Petralouisia muris]